MWFFVNICFKLNTLLYTEKTGIVHILNKMTVNKRIRQVRQALSMSQKDFSAAIRVSTSYIPEIENENRKANDRIIRLICLTFGVSEVWLKTGKGEMFQSSPIEKRERILNLFNELNPQFQDYAIAVIDRLLLLQKDKPK